ncbi:MAG: NosD domain-containing protein [Candidatus Thorarchaeota archaeon SMTZ1-45]|nr:MAG: hypothetical protein AM325_08870 [Candidatus Thorarchaeota archaeon SMTZ1-45]
MIRHSVALLLIAIIGLSFLTDWYTPAAMKKPVVKITSRQPALSYIPYEPFNISSDVDFETQSWPGNGTQTNPYLIENLNITTNSSPCIWIMNTTSYFVVQNCLFTSSIQEYTPYYPLNTLTITNVSNGEINGNYIIESPTGISAYSISNCKIINNQFNVSWSIIEARLCNFTTISNNNQEIDSCDYGISIFGSRNCTISQNSFTSNKHCGIIVGASHFSSITENIIIAFEPYYMTWVEWTGIYLQGGEYCLVNNNEIVGADPFGCSFECPVSIGIDISGFGHIVEDNNIILNRRGILVHANNTILRRNILTNNYVSFELAIANETDVYENSISGYESILETGITISGGFDCTIHSNLISHVGQGIVLQGASGFNISQNIVNDSRYGLKFSWAPSWYYADAGPSFDCDIIGNSLSTGGIYPNIENFDSWDFNTIRFLNNTVNAKSIGFYAYLDGTVIDGNDYGQIFLVSCNNVTLTEGDFHGITSDRWIWDEDHSPGMASAITLLDCQGCEISGVRYHNNTIGMNIQESTDIIISSPIGFDNSWAATIVWRSDTIVLSGCVFKNNLKGIAAGWSWDVQIFTSYIFENNEGLILANSPNCSILNNVIFENTDAILLEESDICEIRGNTIYLNSQGILLSGSSDCKITQNNVYNSTGVGIWLDLTSHRNEIYNNVFAYNSPNAICEGSSNHWDDQVDTGNWWSDYAGDGPYIIDEDDQDNFPNRNITTTSSTTTLEPRNIDPLLLGLAGGVIGIIAIAIMIIDRRRVKIID